MKHPLVRTIYLYLFTLVGLALISFGAVRLVNVGLKLFVFTKADDQYHDMRKPPLIMPRPFGEEITEEDFVAAIEKCEEQCELNEIQQRQLSNWLRDYRDWQNQPKVDFKMQQRQRESASALAAIIVGLPLYLYHWGIIRKEKHTTQS